MPHMDSIGLMDSKLIAQNRPSESFRPEPPPLRKGRRLPRQDFEIRKECEHTKSYFLIKRFDLRQNLKKNFDRRGPLWEGVKWGSNSILAVNKSSGVNSHFPWFSPNSKEFQTLIELYHFHFEEVSNKGLCYIF